VAPVSDLDDAIETITRRFAELEMLRSELSQDRQALINYAALAPFAERRNLPTTMSGRPNPYYQLPPPMPPARTVAGYLEEIRAKERAARYGIPRQRTASPDPARRRT
jgi:hypothetical protein